MAVAALLDLLLPVAGVWLAGSAIGLAVLLSLYVGESRASAKQTRESRRDPGVGIADPLAGMREPRAQETERGDGDRDAPLRVVRNGRADLNEHSPADG